MNADGVALINAGGVGTNSSISGASVTYAVGGKGYHRNGSDSDKNTAGAPNTGNGGNGVNSSAGGSGIVIVRYLLPPTGTMILLR